MLATLLATKLSIPPARSRLVQRTRLFERLDAGLSSRLVLVSAPAGFGKTTLLGEWARSRNQPVAWLSLDKGDNNPARFWAYLILALQAIHEEIGESALAALRSAQPPPIEAVVTTVINDVADLVRSDRPVPLILDDYQVVETPALHEGLASLVEYLPVPFCLVIAGRADPPLPLAHLRSRGLLAELRASDLRFTATEAAAFLNQSMELRLTAEDIAALESRTEGWIAGLQLAALSLQGQSPEHVTDFIADFTGSHRYVLDYLTEEVLQRQPAQVQEFLLQTAGLDRMTAPLCDTVTGRSDSQAMLEYLERANLFVVPLDERRQWYRYHHLFADLLRSRLEQSRPGQVATLHYRASTWYEQNGAVAEAVAHALAAGDIERAAALIEGNVLALLGYRELPALLGWLEALPQDIVRERPWLGIAYAWALLYAGHLGAADRFLQEAEKHVPGWEKPAGTPAAVLVGIPSARPVAVEVSAEEAEARHIVGHITTIRAYHAGLAANYARAGALSRHALEYLPESDLMARGFATTLQAIALRRTGDLAAAADAFTEAIAISQATGDTFVADLSRGNLAGLRLEQGRLHEAATIFRRIAQPERAGRGGTRPPTAGLAHGRLATILCEWNDLEAALRHARLSLEISTLWGQAEFVLTNYLDMAEVLSAMGDAPGMLEAIRRARQAQQDLPWPSWLTALEVQLRLSLGDEAYARRWLQESGLGIEDEIRFPERMVYVTLARVLLLEGRNADALHLLGRLLRLVESTGSMGIGIKVLVLQSLALQSQGRSEQALAALARALAVGEPEGYVRTFISEGAPLAQLLQQAVKRGVMGKYAGRLLAAIKGIEEQDTAAGEAQRSTAQAAPAPVARGSVAAARASSALLPAAQVQPLVEPLSTRELEVLELLAAGLANKEIAQRLVISVGTVKNHLKSIYGKLEVDSRTRAVARGRELGLL
jgi:LuxR family maltose regulon positive regulatory protein